MKMPNAAKTRIPRPPILTARTQKLVGALEQELGVPVLVYWLSTGGSICQNDVIAMSRLLRPMKRQPRVALFSGSGT